MQCSVHLPTQSPIQCPLKYMVHAALNKASCNAPGVPYGALKFPSHAPVHTRLATSVCQLRHGKMEQGPTEPHAGRSTFLPSFGVAGGRYYWVASGMGPIPTENQFPCRTLVACLVRTDATPRAVSDPLSCVTPCATLQCRKAALILFDNGSSTAHPDSNGLTCAFWAHWVHSDNMLQGLERMKMELTQNDKQALKRLENACNSSPLAARLLRWDSSFMFSIVKVSEMYGNWWGHPVRGNGGDLFFTLASKMDQVIRHP